MLWQAMDHFCYRTPSAYMNVPDAAGRLNTVQPSFTSSLLQDMWVGKRPSVDAATVELVRKDLRGWAARAVVVIDATPAADQATALFTEVLGRPPVRRDDSAQWSLDSDGPSRQAQAPGASIPSSASLAPR
jgi:hypothetical protein